MPPLTLPRRLLFTVAPLHLGVIKSQKQLYRIPHTHPVLIRWPRRVFSSTCISRLQRSRNSTPSSAPAPATVVAVQEDAPEQTFQKKKSARSQSSKISLRRVAAASEAAKSTAGYYGGEQRRKTKLCTAYCTAEKYDLSLAALILLRKGYTIDPNSTGLVDQVLHLRLPTTDTGATNTATANNDGELGDIFIFPSGNIVSWSVPSPRVSSLANTLLPAAEKAQTNEVETEDLEYIEDPRLRRSRHPEHWDHHQQQQALGAPDELNITLAKIAFSSGLARSTKLAVLESLLNEYLAGTSTIPTLLSRGSRLPFTRSFILRKTGELLEFRAQLNLYSELTDSLPDIFWDSRHELGLEGYYESVGRALDVNVRIRQLNEKLDYASGIVEVLRERLSEKHSLGLEWMIILLITVEVGFEVLRLWKEGSVEEREEREYRRWKERKEREEDEEYRKWKMMMAQIKEK
ncbi:uncharacterized protein LAJ45_06069 [Morchella importuna]|uniref:uncharacterized protein n=1 Tax=Morchella importuna TaxID=1174673 RepID=UPI001E8D7FB3|nr:uncharacterized protein LAJ45_06069 [Morchella importuna]KAH8149917.1 hypothetical protein LAJ45_06069 [Morchella importuna]